MPGYKGSGQAKLLRANQQAFLFQNELITAPAASVAVQLERVPRSFYPWGVSFQLSFANAAGAPADPGAFEVDIQTSDVDADPQYCMINQFVGDASLNATFAGRIELPSFYAKFIRAKLVTLPNPVYVTLVATR